MSEAPYLRQGVEYFLPADVRAAATVPPHQLIVPAPVHLLLKQLKVFDLPVVLVLKHLLVPSEALKINRRGGHLRRQEGLRVQLWDIGLPFQLRKQLDVPGVDHLFFLGEVVVGNGAVTGVGPQAAFLGWFFRMVLGRFGRGNCFADLAKPCSQVEVGGPLKKIFLLVQGKLLDQPLDFELEGEGQAFPEFLELAVVLVFEVDVLLFDDAVLFHELFVLLEEGIVPFPLFLQKQLQLVVFQPQLLQLLRGSAISGEGNWGQQGGQAAAGDHALLVPASADFL